jgi:hypothetical protein
MDAPEETGSDNLRHVHIYVNKSAHPTRPQLELQTLDTSGKSTLECLSQPNPCCRTKTQCPRAKGVLDMMLATSQAARQMLKPPLAPASTPFLDHALVTDWGYQRGLWLIDELAACLPVLGLFENPVRGTSARLSGLHWTTTIRNGHEYRQTNAMFDTTIDRNNGVSAAWTAQGPAASDWEPGRLMPNLYHWSDIVHM